MCKYGQSDHDKQSAGFVCRRLVDPPHVPSRITFHSEYQPWTAFGLGLPTNGRSTQKLQRNNMSCRIETPYIIRIAGNYEVLPLPGDYHDRRVDKIRSPRCAAEFSAGTGKLVVKRSNLNLLAPQEPRLRYPERNR
jgi:hypothetical protein